MAKNNSTEGVIREQIFSIPEAAEYLGVVASVVRYHVYQSKYLQPDFRLGRELGFYKSTLDAYMRKYQSDDLTLKEAAKYLGVTTDRIEYHYHVLGTIAPTARRGKFVTFKRAHLDAARPVITTRSQRGRKSAAVPAKKKPLNKAAQEVK